MLSLIVLFMIWYSIPVYKDYLYVRKELKRMLFSGILVLTCYLVYTLIIIFTNFTTNTFLLKFIFETVGIVLMGLTALIPTYFV